MPKKSERQQVKNLNVGDHFKLGGTMYRIQKIRKSDREEFTILAYAIEGKYRGISTLILPSSFEITMHTPK